MLVPLSLKYSLENPEPDFSYVELETSVSGYSVASVQLGDASSETTLLPGATKSGFTT